ncbi:MAG TPA: Gfo/Idh/MocA family oxidoreductase [Candidatus Tumulicola sp.]
MKPYRIGIVGAGFGTTSHLPALLASPRFEVVALASPSTAQRVASERGIAHAFRSCREMLEGCELDAVTVASPPFAHHEDVSAALDAGKNVLCEKPFALDVAQAQDLVARSERAGTACGIAHEFRYVPQIQALHELVANHHLDPVRDVEVTALRSSLRASVKRERSWWFDRARGGGMAGAMLSHIIDQATFVLGRMPGRTLGLVRTANPERVDDRGTFASNVDDGAFALVEYGDGIVARLCIDAATGQDAFTCAVHGESRSAVASGDNITDLTLFSIDAEETNELECSALPHASYASVNANVPLLMELYRQFADAIDGKPNALPTFQEALVTQRVLAAVGFGANEPPSDLAE